MKRFLNIGLTPDQYRALRAAVRLAQEDDKLIREEALPTLDRAWQAIEGAWEAQDPPRLINGETSR
jgi:hypothetical protein